MTSDLQSLLAAIVSDPTDDTARLVYADCLQEHGNSARAEFIRLQIEAERLHPDSNARAELERKAHSLFAEHWIEWWGEVCAAVGLRPPAPKPSGRLGKLARWAGFGAALGVPYSIGPESRFGLWQNQFTYQEENQGFSSTVFQRGFPDSLVVGSWGASAGDCLAAKWANVSPLDALNGDESALGPAGPHLAGVRSFTLRHSTPSVLFGWLNSPHLMRVDELAFQFIPPQTGGVDFASCAEQLTQVLTLPRVRQLKRLHLPVWSRSAAAALANAPNLAELEALDVELHTDSNVGEPAEDALAILARSPHLANLKELGLSGGLNPDVCRAISAQAAWTGLRKLVIGYDWHEDPNDPGVISTVGDVPGTALETLLLETNLPALEELRIHSLFLTREVIDALVRSPLMKQLKHFACAAVGVDGVARTDLHRLPQMFDLDRIETFAFNPDHAMPGLGELQRQLGDRLRLPW